MRCSTLAIYQSNMHSIAKAMVNANNTRTQLSEGKTLLKPSDNPEGASQALTYQHALTSVAQYDIARADAKDTLGYEDNALNAMSGLLTKNLTEKMVAVGNGTYSAQSKQALAAELEGIRDGLINLANSKNGHGRYIFSGYKTASQPFSPEGHYTGGNQPITQWVGEETEMQVSHLGSQIFVSAEYGNLFIRLDEIIAALNNDSGESDLQVVLQQTNKAINHSLDSLGNIQASVGTNLQMLDRLGFNSADNALLVQGRYQKSIGSGDESMIRLVSEVAITEQALQSSMLLFNKVQNISLFNMN